MFIGISHVDKECSCGWPYSISSSSRGHTDAVLPNAHVHKDTFIREDISKAYRGYFPGAWRAVSFLGMFKVWPLSPAELIFFFFLKSYFNGIASLTCFFQLKSLWKGQPGWLSGLALPLAQGLILETPDRVPRRAPCMEPAYPSACISASLSLSLSLSLMNK